MTGRVAVTLRARGVRRFADDARRAQTAVALLDCDAHLARLARDLTGLTGRPRRSVLQRIDVWLDQRLALTRPET